MDNIESLDSSILINFLKKYFERPCTSLKFKADLIIKYINENNIDVMFVQEGGSINWEEEISSPYAFKKNHDSVIIYNTTKFNGVNSSLQEKYESSLNFNEDSVCYFTSNNYLLISAHLTSKNHKTKQADQMFEVLNKISSENE